MICANIHYCVNNSFDGQGGCINKARFESFFLSCSSMPSLPYSPPPIAQSSKHVLNDKQLTKFSLSCDCQQRLMSRTPKQRFNKHLMFLKTYGLGTYGLGT